MLLKLLPTYVYDKAPNVWNITLFSLISVAFLVSDWVILYSSFGDFVLAFTVLLFVILGQVKISGKEFMFASIPFIFMFINYVVNAYLNDYYYDTTRAYLSAGKVFLYISTLLLTYSFVRRKYLMRQFLKVSNIFAVLSILIGIGITLMIYFNREEFYTLIWTFTRTDQVSYLFNENPNIVRTRGLFSEPAHLGFYLNIIFFANIFSKEKKKKIIILF